MAGLWRGYLRLLRDYTLPTQMATSGVLIPLGDSIAQHFIEKKELKDHDWARTSRFFFYGSSMWAPLQYNWHRQLNKVAFDKMWKTAAARLAIDASVFAPFGQCYFFVLQGTLEGRTWRDIKNRISSNFTYVYSRGLMVFGPVQILNLTIVPVWARPPVLNCVSLGWATFLATVNRRESKDPREETRLIEAIADQPI